MLITIQIWRREAEKRAKVRKEVRSEDLEVTREGQPRPGYKHDA